MSIKDKINGLTPAGFEHFIYDLMLQRGLRNATWRTPGADGGRDIEGDYFITDMSGRVLPERWYIECKKYSNSVDWPTVFPKLSYASNHKADFLLMCTSNYLSPKCKDEVDRYNFRRERPAIRYWDVSDLESFIAIYPDIGVKHGLIAPSSMGGPSIKRLLAIGAKASQAACGDIEGLGIRIPRSLEFSAAIAELSAVIDHGASLTTRIINDDDLYDWVKVTSGSHAKANPASLRALLALLNFVALPKGITLTSSGGAEVKLEIDTPGRADWASVGTYIEASQLLNLYCNVEFKILGNVIEVQQRWP
ncbi:restriction endonuclease [Nevskia sp.]|uniref:restriction endonuclease n=1 Tax=Nevskia sp. TaxID=1929292 RepID=UPI0025D7797C|nr:restriction endonuclease [Nevskia sp.]